MLLNENLPNIPASGYGNDPDPEETQEWNDSLEQLVKTQGANRAGLIMESLIRNAGKLSVTLPSNITTNYVNSISADEEPAFPGDEEVESRYCSWIRWNAAIMVHRAQRPGIGVGGHISTYAGAAMLYDVSFNHFFKGKGHPSGGDQVFFQGHASPGIYARAFLEGRLTENDLDGFRQQASHSPHGLPSYPHPRQMPRFWQFPTVSMGIGPMNAIYQAQNNRYLHNRGIKDTSGQHVWAFLGDGEMDEPESRGLIQAATNDSLDNLTFVVNANLQRLDGPVRGNGKIVQELEALFKGAGWNVVKVLWDRQWDNLFRKDKSGQLVDIMNTTLDGDFQTYRGESGGFIREHFFGKTPETMALVRDLSDDDIWDLQRGGHDYRKIYAAYDRAVNAKNGKPTIVIALTVKGYGLGANFEARNASHQMKKMTIDDIKKFRDHLGIPISDAQIESNPYQVPYYNPGVESPEIKYMLERRQALGGFVPERGTEHKPLPLPSEKAYAQTRKGSGSQEAATTMAFVRLLKDLMREKGFGDRIVPIIPDEARTFGMDSFFPTAKIYNPAGQRYTSVDRGLLLSYKESSKGQILHVGINEAGSIAALAAAGTSYATHGEPLVPVYIFYSMFGFQRTADYIWAATDQMTRGFMIGATAGRTTLTGEGLQHADGHSPLIASTNPAVVSYDPAYGYEIAHIVRDGLERMYGKDSDARNLLYYLTVYNEPIVQPAEPENVDVEGILGGIYKLSKSTAPGSRAQILASGVAVPWALEAQKLLAEDWNVRADVWSVTSWSQLRRDGLEAEEDAFLNPGMGARTPFVASQLSGAQGPVIAVSDYMKAVPDQIRQFVPNEFASLGADDFGFSDTRPAARRYFKIDGPSIVVRTLEMLARRGEVDWHTPGQAIQKYDLHNVNAGTTGNEGGES